MATSQITIEDTTCKNKIRKSGLSGKTTLILMGLPCLLLLLAFSYIPLLGWSIAFFDYTPGLNLFKCDFTGFKYFKLAIFEPELLIVLRNTLVMSLLNLLTTPFPMFFAILLSEMASKKSQKIVQTVTTFPYFISWVLVFSIAFAMFSTGEGMVNSIMRKISPEKSVDVLGNEKIVWYFQMAVVLWKNTGFNAIIYLATISSISPDLYDAASVDGAGRIGKIIHITLPGLMPTFFVLLVLTIGNLLSTGFEQYYLFYNPLVHNKIQVLDYYVYRLGITLGDYSLSTALGMSKSIISIILLTIANVVAKKVRGFGIF